MRVWKNEFNKYFDEKNKIIREKVFEDKLHEKAIETFIKLENVFNGSEKDFKFSDEEKFYLSLFIVGNNLRTNVFLFILLSDITGIDLNSDKEYVKYFYKAVSDNVIMLFATKLFADFVKNYEKETNENKSE